MALSLNHSSFISQVESTDQLDGRYEEISCVNLRNGQRKGVLSLVFQAKDILTDKNVAIKFMDPEKLSDTYRAIAFEREPEIIKKLGKKKRCLKLTSGLNIFEWELTLPGTATQTQIPIKYFVVEWLENDIEDYFYVQHAVSTLEKLEIFRLILLAVEAIHAEGVNHRDLKPDNLRATICDGEKVVMVIDFNTAARHESPNIATSYVTPVGANAYSAPEAFAGLAGERDIGHLTDIYALGCLLFELFNKDIFAAARVANPHFEYSLLIFSSAIGAQTTYAKKIDAWKTTMSTMRHLLDPPTINYPGNSVPPCLSTLLDGLCRRMTDYNFLTRENSTRRVLRTIDSAIAVLNNEKKQALELERKRQSRRRRNEKVAAREARLEQYLSSRKLLC